jgi:hypothetical protein
MGRCEICREWGWTDREAYPHRLTDGQRLTLCVGHARAWRLREPSWYPVPYGAAARQAHEDYLTDRGGPILGVTANT